MSYYIYRMTHTPTGRTYIGQRKMPKGCLCPYLDKYNGSGTVWKRIFKAHPGECSKEVLAVAVSKADIDRLEIRYIADERSNNPEGCVNIAVGGDGFCSGEKHPFYGKHFSDEHRRKLSEARKGKLHSEEVRRKLSEAHKGKQLSEEHRRMMSEAHKGMQLSDETRSKISAALKGRVSPTKGKQLSDETRRKLSEANKGKHLSEETKKKIAEARRAYLARKKALTVNN